MNSSGISPAPRILVADDSTTIRTILSMLLGEAGYDVLAARDGQEALDMLARQGVALALLDVKMPRLDGYEVCRRLREECGDRKTKVVYLTSLGSDSDREWGLSQGADAYLIKPVQEDQLLATIHELLDRSRAA